MSEPSCSVGSTPLLCDSTFRFRFLTNAAFSNTDSRMLEDLRFWNLLFQDCKQLKCTILISSLLTLSEFIVESEPDEE